MIADSYISRMEHYRVNSSEDEWFTAKLFDGLLGQREPHDAFDSLVEYSLNEAEGDLFYDHIQFLSRLGHKADTSESPQS